MAQLCSFQLAGMSFGIAALEVQEIMRAQAITRVPLADPAIAGLVNLRGQVVTAIDLRTRLRFAPRAPAALPIHVVVRTADAVFSLLVDAIGDVLELDGELDAIPETVPAHLREVIAGAYTLPDRLLFVLVLDRIVALPVESP